MLYIKRQYRSEKSLKQHWKQKRFMIDFQNMLLKIIQRIRNKCLQISMKCKIIAD